MKIKTFINKLIDNIKFKIWEKTSPSRYFFDDDYRKKINDFNK